MQSAFVAPAVLLPLIAEPEADIAAVVLAVVLFAIPVLLTVVAFTLKGSGIPGGVGIGNAILRFEKRIASSLASKVESAIRPFTILISTPMFILDRIVATIEAALDELRAKVHDVKRGTVPHYFHSANAHAQGLFHNAEHYAHVLASENDNRITHYYELGRAHTDHAVAVAVRHVEASVAHSEAYTRAEVGHEHDVILHYYRLADGRITHTEDMLYKRMDLLHHLAEGYAHAEDLKVTEHLGGTIAKVKREVESDIGKARKIATDFIDDCGKDLCNGLHDVARDMPKLRGVFTTGLLLAFVAEAVHNPEGTARFVVDDLYEPVDNAAHELWNVVRAA